MSKLTKVSTVSDFLTMLFLLFTAISIGVDLILAANLINLVMTFVLITLFFTSISDLLESYIYYSCYDSDKKQKKLITASYIFQVLFECGLYIFALCCVFTAYSFPFTLITAVISLLFLCIADFLSNIAKVKYKHITRLTLITIFVVGIIGMLIYR